MNDAFWKWFKGSKIVDKDGNPLVCYHGTPNAGFEEFKPMSHFTKNKDYADVYQGRSASSIQYKPTADNPQTYEVYLSIKNPFDTRDRKAREIYLTEYEAYYSPDLTDKGMNMTVYLPMKVLQVDTICPFRTEVFLLSRLILIRLNPLIIKEHGQAVITYMKIG